MTDEPTQRLAAATYALDRAIGRIVQAAEVSGEPTIFVFMNDNGGPYEEMNTPLHGYKGLTWEGGIRVPFFIHMPGVAPGIYDKPISMYDILPTVYAAAGGDVAQLHSDGVDLMPYLSGANTQDPHKVLVWQTHNIWALRKGDWKLGSPTGGPPVLYDLANDPGETTDVFAQNPTVVADLIREMTEWESNMDKHRWGPGFANPFDHFVYTGNNGSFNLFGMWTNAATGEPVQLRRSDGNPNLILEFRTKNTSNYGAFNSMTRETSQPMMVNEIRLTGDFTSPIPFAGGPSGNPLLLVDNLSGASPKIRLDATSSETAARFQFQIHSQLQLFDNLEFVGDGTQDFIITGDLRDFYEPRSVTKSGTSILTLKGNNTFGGDLVINGGEVKLTGSIAAINGANAIKIGSAGAFSMNSGLVAVDRIEREPGAGLQFTGGEIRTSSVVGDLTNQGGNFSPGASAAQTTVTGDYAQTSGTLTIELGGIIPGEEYDTLDVSGLATLGGTLNVRLMPDFVPSAGQSFEFLTAEAGIVGNFNTTILPSVSDTLQWQMEYLPNSLRLSLLGDVNIPPSSADYNRDGIVDAADYVVWRKNGGTQAAYDLWRANFETTAGAGSLSDATVPEPTNWMLLLPLVILASGNRYLSYRECS